MKVFQWTNLIGILCIFFVAQGILLGGIVLIMTGSYSLATGIIPNQPAWMTISHYIRLLVDMVYLVAGIFFLKRKSFSLLLMYTALILSLLSSFIPVIIIGFQQAKIPWQLLNIFFFIGPTIHLFFLFCVYRISKYYYTDPEKEVYLLKLGNLGQTGIKSISIIGFLMLLIPVFLFGLWYYVSSLGLGYPENVERYHQYLPAVLRSRYGTAHLSLFCSAAAFILSSIGLRLPDKGWRRWNTSVLIISVLMGMINLWSMM